MNQAAHMSHSGYVWTEDSKPSFVLLSDSPEIKMEKSSGADTERGTQEDTEVAPTTTVKGRKDWIKVLGLVLGLCYLTYRFPIVLNRSRLEKWSGYHHHRDQVGCPYQPDPLHPLLRWNVSDEEKSISVDHFSQAVVSQVSPPPLGDVEPFRKGSDDMRSRR